jgi:hypothetical protein
MRRTLLLIPAAVLVIAAPAGAQELQTPRPTLNEAAEAFRSGETVHIDPDARDVLSEADAREVEQRIADEGERVFVAVLPEGAGTGNLAGQIGNAVQVKGTYVAVAGDAWSAASSELAGDPGGPARRGRAARLAQRAPPARA